MSYSPSINPSYHTMSRVIVFKLKWEIIIWGSFTWRHLRILPCFTPRSNQNEAIFPWLSCSSCSYLPSFLYLIMLILIFSALFQILLKKYTFPLKPVLLYSMVHYSSSLRTFKIITSKCEFTISSFYFTSLISLILFIAQSTIFSSE
jgi:hypothetical protein